MKLKEEEVINRPNKKVARRKTAVIVEEIIFEKFKDKLERVEKIKIKRDLRDPAFRWTRSVCNSPEMSRVATAAVQVDGSSRRRLYSKSDSNLLTKVTRTRRTVVHDSCNGPSNGNGRSNLKSNGNSQINNENGHSNSNGNGFHSSKEIAQAAFDKKAKIQVKEQKSQTITYKTEIKVKEFFANGTSSSSSTVSTLKKYSNETDLVPVETEFVENATVQLKSEDKSNIMTVNSKKATSLNVKFREGPISNQRIVPENSSVNESFSNSSSTIIEPECKLVQRSCIKIQTSDNDMKKSLTEIPGSNDDLNLNGQISKINPNCSELKLSNINRIPLSLNHNNKPSNSSSLSSKSDSRITHESLQTNTGTSHVRLPSSTFLYLLSLDFFLHLSELVLFVIFVFVNLYNENLLIAVMALFLFMLVIIMPMMSKTLSRLDLKLIALIREEFSNGQFLSKLIQLQMFNPMMWLILHRRIAKKYSLYPNDIPAKENFEILQSLHQKYNKTVGTVKVFNAMLMIMVIFYSMLVVVSNNDAGGNTIVPNGMSSFLGPNHRIQLQNKGLELVFGSVYSSIIIKYSLHIISRSNGPKKSTGNGKAYNNS